jgi:hypothetical protein
MKKIIPASLLTVQASSKEDREKMHAAKTDGKDRMIPGMMAFFQNGQNRDLNRKMRLGHSLPNTSTQPHIGIKTAFFEVIGRGSIRNSKFISHSGVLFHGQTHKPIVDEHGIITQKSFTSWTSNPSIAMQFVKPKGEDKEVEHDAHHVFVLNHEPNHPSGHALFSLHSKEHSSARFREEEAVSGPARYKVLKTEHVGNHPETGKPVFQYIIEPVESHPNWNSQIRGPLTVEEKQIISNVWEGFTG